MRLIERLARAVARRGGSDQGFTLVVALGVMAVTGLLLVAGFTAVTGDTKLAREDLSQKQAYYAALAGVQEYEYQLERSPNFWQSCTVINEAQKQEANTHYQVEVLPASSAPEGTTKCNPAKPFETAIESKGRATNTFRVKSTGYAGKEARSLVATFGVNGFLDYVYFTRYEDEDPSLDGANVKECSKERSERPGGGACGPEIEFAPEDSVRGPMHTDDAALICGNPSFGREARLKQGSPDAVEIHGGPYSNGCSSSPTYNTASGKPAVGEEASILVPPEEDTSLKAYVEAGYEFEGVTTLELEGTEVTVTNAQYNGGNPKRIALPKNGLIYIRSMSSKPCNYVYKQNSSDSATNMTEEVPCGTAYVKGNYNASLTIGAEREIVVRGNITPTGVTPPSSGTAFESELGGTNVLGLIASKFVRIYHPCPSSKEELKNPWIYAAMLSTGHSFAVDNYNCGNPLGYLNIDGAIAQNFRGIIGEPGSHGFLKNYNYDERLATDEPPYFLAPLKAGWRIIRETAPKAG